jgi:hypothetical protein
MIGLSGGWQVASGEHENGDRSRSEFLWRSPSEAGGCCGFVFVVKYVGAPTYLIIPQ